MLGTTHTDTHTRARVRITILREMSPSCVDVIRDFKQSVRYTAITGMRDDAVVLSIYHLLMSSPAYRTNMIYDPTVCIYSTICMCILFVHSYGLCVYNGRAMCFPNIQMDISILTNLDICCIYAFGVAWIYDEQLQTYSTIVLNTSNADVRGIRDHNLV